MNPKLIYALFAITLFFIEVIIASKLNGYHFIRSYFGDFLVVILLYCMAKAVFDFNEKSLAISVFTIAVLVETAQYFHLADILKLAPGGVARIVLGTSFSFHDLLMYAAGTLLVYYLDTHFRMRKQMN